MSFGRILLKLSGEALMGSQNYGIDTAIAESVAAEIKAVANEIGKVLAIFISVAGIAFLGFAAVTAVGGPNWQAQMEDPDLGNYLFERSDSVPPLM